MKIREIIGALEQFAPLSLQDGFDNAGMQIGLTVDAESSGVLLCLDVTEEVVEEASEKGCDLIVSHHPLIFHAPKRLTGEDYVQRTIIKAIQKGINVYASHTNLDNAPGGVNWKIAERLGLKDCKFFAQKTVDGLEAGSGVVGELPSEMDARAFIELVKKQFGVQCAQCNALLERPIRKVAICGGAGDFLLPDAISQDADAFITGEMHYHQYFGTEQQIQICVIGHYQSEQFTSEIFRDIILKECPDVRTEIAETCTNPIYYY